jgi:cytidylate kinase
MSTKFRPPIAISGYGGSGKSTAARLVAKKLGFELKSGGNYMRELAEKMGLNPSNGEFQKYRETHPEIDYKLDSMQFEALRKGGIVLESRFGVLYHPHSSSIVLNGFHEKIGVNPKHILPPGHVFTIYLSCDTNVRYQRLYKRISEDPKTAGITFEQVVRDEEKRQSSDYELYEKSYGLNPFDSFYSEYHIAVEDLSPEENAEKIVRKYQKHIELKGLKY